MIDIGVDILKISRIEALMHTKNCDFLSFFTRREHDLSLRYSNPAVFYAERFACKEAVFKCFNIEMKTEYLRQIETLNLESGKPYVSLYGTMEQIACERRRQNIGISISYDGDYVVAFAAAGE